MPTTATEWLQNHPGDLDVLNEVITSSGVPGIKIITEIPEWMQQSISEQLTESFKQPYWADISKTTGGDAERFLREGLAEGQSFRTIANRMAGSFQGHTGKYAQMRGMRVARTEGKNAVNGARVGSIDRLIQELGEAGQFVQKVWLSVLGLTTRDSHANLDGTPADKNGMWLLGGVLVPWPGHFTLSAGERINCLCSILTEFGMGEEERDQLIQEYSERIGASTTKPSKLKPRSGEARLIKLPGHSKTKINLVTPEYALSKRAQKHLRTIASGAKTSIAKAPKVSSSELFSIASLFVFPQEAFKTSRGMQLGVFKAPKKKMMLGGPRMNVKGPLRPGSQFADNSGLGVVRHEYGHSFYHTLIEESPVVKAEWDSIFASKTKEQWSKLISGYAVTNEVELFAESFVIWSHPDYEKLIEAGKITRLPKIVEDFFRENL